MTVFILLIDNVEGWSMGGWGSPIRNDSSLCQARHRAVVWRSFVTTSGVLLLITLAFLTITLHNPDPTDIDPGPPAMAPDL